MGVAFDWNDVLHLPEMALSEERTIQKTILVAQGGLTKREEKKLNELEALTCFASLSKTNTYMLPINNEDYCIESIVLLRCVLRVSTSPLELGNIVHKIFPNPTALLFEAPDGRIGVSVAIKRRSLAEHGAVVTESVQNTGLFDPEAEAYQGFIKSIGYNSLPQKDLLSFASALSTRCMLCRTVQPLGFYPVCKETRVDALLDQVRLLQSLQSEVNALQNKRKDSETSLADSTIIRLELNEKRRQCDEAAEKIRSLCNG